MRLIIVRHGLTEENIKGITQGQTPGKLTPKGIKQAKKVGLRLKDEKIDFIYSSDLQRVIDTTKEIIKYHPNIPVYYVKELREFTKGVFDGKPRTILKEYRKTINGPFHEHRFEKGESLADVQKRIFQFYQKTLEKYPDKTILWITHGGVISQLLLKLLNKHNSEFKDVQPENCAITIIEVDKNKNHNVTLLNCIKHLD